jgi:hypothetical protein
MVFMAREEVMPKICKIGNNDNLLLSKSRRRVHPLHSVPNKYRNRPALLRAAMRIVWEKMDEFQFTRADVSVLQAIIASGVSVDTPSQPIFARKTTLAKLANVAPRTVFRALKKFEENGFIVREIQSRLEDGCLEITKILPTEKFIFLFELNKNNNEQQEITNNNNSKKQFFSSNAEEGKKQHDGNIAQNPRIASQDLVKNPAVSHGLSHGSVYKELKKEQVPTVNNQSPTLSVPNSNSQNEFVRYQGRSVARELFWLIQENRLTLSGLFLLQKMAKNIGQKLSDFVQLRAERLKELRTPGDCFRYLRSLIVQGMDASYLCMLKLKQKHQTHRAEQKKIAQGKRKEALMQFDAKYFQDPDTERVYRIEPKIEMVMVHESDGFRVIHTARLTTSMLNSIRQGKWRPWTPPKIDKVARASLLASILGKKYANC